MKKENDIGILVLDYAIGLYSGWFGLTYLPDDVTKS